MVSLEQNPTVQSNTPSLTDLIRAFQDINNQTDFGVLANTVLNQAERLFQAQALVLLLVNKVTGELEIAAVKNVPEENIAAYLQKPSRAAVVEAAMQHEGLDQPASASASLAQLAAAGFPHVFMVPILIQAKVIGYLSLAAGQPLGMAGERREKFNLLLEHCAQAIENAYFIYQLRQQTGRLEVMMTKLQNTQAHLKHAEKMALVGKIAARLAHEIRNPLSVINGSLQMAFEKMDPQHPDKALFATLLGKVRDVDQTIKELMVFARPLELSPRRLELAATLERVMAFVRKNAEARGVRVETKIPASLPAMHLDEEHIQRILIHLILSAVQALPADGALCIEAGHDPGQPWITLRLAGEKAQMTLSEDETGFGVFLAQHVLEEMNAFLDIRHDGANLEFILRLPLAK